MGISGGFFAEDELIFSKDKIQLRKSDVERIRVKLAKSLSKLSVSRMHNTATEPNPVLLKKPSTISAPTVSTHSPATHPNPLPLVSAPVIHDPITSKHGDKKFSDLFEQYKKTRNWGNDASRRMETEAGLFIELMDDPKLSTIDGELINQFADELSKLPSDIYLAKRRLKTEKLKDLKNLPANLGLNLKQPQTIKGNVKQGK